MPKDKKEAQSSTGTVKTVKRSVIQAQVTQQEWSRFQGLLTETGMTQAEFVRQRCLKDNAQPPVPLVNIKLYHAVLRSTRLLKALQEQLPQLQSAGIQGPWDTADLSQLIEQVRQDALNAVGITPDEEGNKKEEGEKE